MVKFDFYPSKLRKQPFLLKISKSRGAPKPLCPPSDAHGCISAFLHQSLDVCLVKLIAEF